jgi:hypothetical protein
MKVEYIRNSSVFSFDHKLSNDDYILFQAGNLNPDGHYERQHVTHDPIPELKQEVIEKIDLFIQEEIAKGFEYNGKIYSMSTNAQLNWSNILNIPSAMFPVDIMSKNEELYSLPLSEKESFYNTCLGFKYATLKRGHALKEALKALSTEELVNSFIIQ